MSLDFTLTPTSDFSEAISVLEPGQMDRIIGSAVKETSATMKTEISKDIRGVLNMKKSDADANINVTAKGSEGAVVIHRTPVPLKVYGPTWSGPQNVWYTRGNPPPVSVQVRVGRGREVITVDGKGAFLVMKIGDNVFVRSGYKHGKYGGPTRRVKVKNKRTGKFYWSELPITKQYGPTLLGVLENRPGMLEKTLDKGQETLDTRIASKVDFVLNGGKI